MLIIRKLNLQDDVYAVAKYIHQTDEYIYPYVFSEFNHPDWVKFISASLKNKHSLFYKDNIIVALLNNKIVGLACINKCGLEYEFPKNIQSKHSVYNGYFRPLINEIKSFDGYYLSILCVDSLYRGRGIGKQLLKVVCQSCQNNITTDAVACNTVAVELYKKAGFVITKEYMGYSGECLDGIACVQLFKLR